MDPNNSRGKVIIFPTINQQDLEFQIDSDERIYREGFWDGAEFGQEVTMMGIQQFIEIRAAERFDGRFASALAQVLALDKKFLLWLDKRIIG